MKYIKLFDIYIFCKYKLANYIYSTKNIIHTITCTNIKNNEDNNGIYINDLSNDSNDSNDSNKINKFNVCIDSTIKKGCNIEFVKYDTKQNFVKSESFKKNYINDSLYI